METEIKIPEGMVEVSKEEFFKQLKSAQPRDIMCHPEIINHSYWEEEWSDQRTRKVWGWSYDNMQYGSSKKTIYAIKKTELK